MAKASNQKQKLLLVLQHLLRHSDEEHPVPMSQLITELERNGIPAERKSLYDDMQAMQQFGIDVQCRKGPHPGWFIGQRQFELAELKLLVDAVQASRFITRKKSDALIGKLETFASTYQARQLQRQVYVDRRVKTMNESIYYTVDKLHTAISSQHVITFTYFDYNIEKKKVYRHNGLRYRVSPCGMIWDNEAYYLVAREAESHQIRHYRVDKIDAVVITCLACESGGTFDMGTYGKKHFGMFGGPEAVVTLRCQKEMVGVVLDRFGHDVMLIPDGEDFFTVTMTLVISPQFYGWLFGIGTSVTVVKPVAVVEEYQQKLQELLHLYQQP